MNRIALALVPLSVLMATPVAAQQVQDVQFARGASGTNINGSITGRDYIDYRIRVSRGQMLAVSLTARSGSPYFNVLEPDSTGEAIFVGSTSGNQFEARTRSAGVYTIRVYQMRASGRQGATARFTLNVSARGGGANSSRPLYPSHSDDRLVRNTPYHATSQIRCVAEPRKPMTSCVAGVTRRGRSATVHLDTPDGGERTILFRDGRAVSSDSDLNMSVQRRGDTSTVRIGRYEIYEIPDAFIQGG